MAHESHHWLHSGPTLLPVAQLKKHMGTTQFKGEGRGADGQVRHRVTPVVGLKSSHFINRKASWIVTSTSGIDSIVDPVNLAYRLWHSIVPPNKRTTPNCPQH